MEDWLNLENELLTSPQMSDEEILATALKEIQRKANVYVVMRKTRARMRNKLVLTKGLAQCFKKCLSWMESQNDIEPDSNL